MRLGRCIVQRRTWTVAPDELDGAHFKGVDVRLLAAAERLRSRRDLPRWVFIRPGPGRLGPTKLVGRHKDHKPVLVDLESYLGIDILSSWIRKHGEIEMIEMLPRPSELWWRESDGRYCHEIRALVTPPRGATQPTEQVVDGEAPPRCR